MRRRKNPLPTLLPTLLQTRPRVKLQLHQLIHIPPDQDIAIQKDHALILRQGKRNQLRPRLGEARVLRVFPAASRCHVGDPLSLDAAGLEHFQAFGWEGRGVECYEWVAGALGWVGGRVIGAFGGCAAWVWLGVVEGVMEREETWEIAHVRDEGGPYCVEMLELQICLRQASFLGILLSRVVLLVATHSALESREAALDVFGSSQEIGSLGRKKNAICK